MLLILTCFLFAFCLILSCMYINDLFRTMVIEYDKRIKMATVEVMPPRPPPRAVPSAPPPRLVPSAPPPRSIISAPPSSFEPAAPSIRLHPITDLTCPICITDVRENFVQCGLCRKFFHRKCAADWFAEEHTCAACRSPVKM